MNNLITLRGAVMSKYRTISSFADEIGWKRNKASCIINGVQEPTSQDIQEITRCLEINSVDIFLQIFFSPMSTIWSNESSEARTKTTL